MKVPTILLLAFPTLPLIAHPQHPPSIYNPELDLEQAHRSPKDHPKVEIRVVGQRRVVESNGIPDHKTGRFPNRDNPNAITPQDYLFSMPVEPEPANRPIEVGHNLFGVALNGVVFDPATAEFYRNRRDSEWNYEALSGEVDLGLDDHHAHVQPNGAYHYHGLPIGLFERLSGGRREMTLIGWAADGFPIYGLYGYVDPEDSGSGVAMLRSSYRLKEGRREGRGSPRGEHDGTYTADYEYIEGLGDLDECNGRVGVTPEFPDGTYHYVLTKDYPFIPRLFRGQPDPSFAKRPPGGGPDGADGGPPPGPPGGRPGPPHGGPPPRR
jgi:hypothetical protein